MISKLDNPKVRQFIQSHINDNPADIALQGQKNPELPIREIADQIASRQRAAKKLPEWYSNKKVIFPPRQNLEQASSERTAKFKTRFCSGKRLLDLTGGTGIDAFYLSEIFEEVTVVEPNQELCALIAHNFEAFEKKVNIHQQKAEAFLETNNQRYDVIYIDPSRRPDGEKRVFGLGEYLPNVIDLQNKLLDIGDLVIIKTSPMIDISDTVQHLQGVSKVVTLAVQHEMKEVLFFMQKGWETEPDIETYNLLHNVEQVFKFQKSDEKATWVDFSEPLSFIYEPNSAVRKAGGFKSVADQFGLEKLHQQTHLYTSDSLISDFPGKTFRFIELVKPDKKVFKRAFKDGKVNVISKNYPLGANEIKKKYSLKDGGEAFLIFCEISGLGKSVLICEIVN